MALDAGVISMTIEFAKDLKDVEWFGRMDPYCIVRIGNQRFRTRTAEDAGRDPVWNETFQANIVSENDVEVEIKDNNVGLDDTIGIASFNLGRAREYGNDRLEVPVLSPRHRTQHGYLSVSLNWQPQPAGYVPQTAGMYGTEMYGMQQQPMGYMPPMPQPQPGYYEGGMAPPPAVYYPPAAGPQVVEEVTVIEEYPAQHHHHHHHHHREPEVIEEVIYERY
ncbi:hypothetical protein Agub_g973 [Astrephomene gubernaculifera]|uniref:C2 domain-containing protein n=1 Tax=Astrephomene gubernaculifera TaxID=47775 RepID=A0AAD3HHD7_9CHLO|nr:hypothetical protein Agub_g973 [Astrephomene gubernaculifera]